MVDDDSDGYEPVTEHLVRRRIYARITTGPGVHYSALREDLGLSDGVLGHHLHVLEREGAVVSRRERNRRCLYPTARGHPERELDQLSDLQAGILICVQTEQGIAQGALAERLGVTKQSLNYHLKELCARKLVYRRKEGRHTRFYVDPGRLAEELL
jgi:predicted transcriptional regulator